MPTPDIEPDWLRKRRRVRTVHDDGWPATTSLEEERKPAEPRRVDLPWLDLAIAALPLILGLLLLLADLGPDRIGL